MMNTRKKGFTLIELMIVLGIAAILVTLALPSFQDALRKSRRSDAMNSIMDLHLAQERWRASDTDYATLAELGPDPLTSPKGHYKLTVTRPLAATATSYTITAIPEALTDQANDYCGNFILTNAAGVITRTTSAGVADLCWRR
jgi:type IV pilus assembly protein PilE